MNFSSLGLLITTSLLVINWLAGLSHRITSNHVANWSTWLWRLFWLFLAIELINDFLANQHILLDGIVLIIAAILSNLSSWKLKTR